MRKVGELSKTDTDRRVGGLFAERPGGMAETDMGLLPHESGGEREVVA
jgi:hypothetical protein